MSLVTIIFVESMFVGKNVNVPATVGKSVKVVGSVCVFGCDDS